MKKVDPKTVKAALKVAALLIAVAAAVVAEWEAGTITDAASFIAATVQAVLNADVAVE